jgi:hypothetical protein
LQPLDVGLQHLDHKERLEALAINNQIQEYEQYLQTNHQNIISIRDWAPQNLNMTEYTEVTPTNPMAPPVVV